jgi:hypothetical protein
MTGWFQMKRIQTPRGGFRVPFGTVDGCMQGAYVAGHSFAVMWQEEYGIYFIGTYLPSLGLEGFEFADGKDGEGRATSGALGSQFVKVATEEELARALEVVVAHLGGWATFLCE